MCVDGQNDAHDFSFSVSHRLISLAARRTLTPKTSMA
jgi:hypothetical protein